MEPKFQSSFIPKGPAATSGNVSPVVAKRKSLMGIIATAIFVLAVLASVGVFGYNRFLIYRIAQMGADLEAARSEVESGVVDELIDLDSRLAATNELLNNHWILSPVFDFLEDSTLQNVRFTEFAYSTESEGPFLTMQGEARGYSAVALQSQAFSENPFFDDPVFSDLNLNDEGNVVFTFRSNIDPEFLSYRRLVEREAASLVPVVPAATTTPSSAATSTSTSTPASGLEDSN